MGGGFYPIKVMNLRLIKTKQNFRKFVAAIFYFDLLLNGANLFNIKVKKNFHFIISNLLNNNLDLPPFILNCFEPFKQTKKQIALNMYYLHQYVARSHVAKEILSLLFHSMDMRNTSEVKETKRAKIDLSNL